jgi:hypothetical protein
MRAVSDAAAAAVSRWQQPHVIYIKNVYVYIDYHTRLLYDEHDARVVILTGRNTIVLCLYYE